MTCENRYDLRITDAQGESHGLLCDWGRGGAGLRIERPSDNLKTNNASTKGSFGVKDPTDANRVIQTDWSEGAGQKTYDRDIDSERAFESSRNIDVSTVGELRLGPQMDMTLQASMLPPLISHGTISNGTPLVWGSFSDASTATNRVRWTTEGSVWTRLASTGPDGSPVSFASDGETLWMASTTGHVYTLTYDGATQYAPADTNTHDITDLAVTAGYLYGAKGTATTDARLGVWLPRTSLPVGDEWTALSPVEGEAINAAGTTFGLVASGNYVYWGVTNNQVTKVLKARYSATAGDVVLTTVATFPFGFVGACMTAYLGTIYVGGHYMWEQPKRGVGSIYAIINDTPARLLDIGGRDSDNRVLAMAPYEKSLYFVSGLQMWRWDLVLGGHSHFAGPLYSMPVTAYADLTWTGTYAMSAAPTGATATIVGSAWAEYNDIHQSANCVQLSAIQNSSVEVVVPETGIGSATTLEVDLPAYAIEDVQVGSLNKSYVGVRNGTNSAKINLSKPNTRGVVGYTCALACGTNTLATFNIPVISVPHTLRLTLDGTSAKAYVDDVLVGSGTTTSSTPDKNIYYGVDNWASSDAMCNFHIDEIRWLDELYDANLVNDVTSEGVGLACMSNMVVASCSGYGPAVTDPGKYVVSDQTITPHILFSRTSGNMPTVAKYFSAVHVTLEAPLPEGCVVTAFLTIDGTAVSIEADETLSEDYLLVFPVPSSVATGNFAQLRLDIENTDSTVTPRIAEAALLFEPVPKVPKSYAYFIRCWQNAQDNSDHDWDEDAVTVADWLEEIAGQVVTVERAGRSSYTGRIEALELAEGPPSGKANGREGLWSLSVKAL